ncbi:MAG: hypothetical protein KDA29_09420 [Phycisphaerales bacterium]|nr:hypothetical protein [Phycisphaerales bacterium]
MMKRCHPFLLFVVAAFSTTSTEAEPRCLFDRLLQPVLSGQSLSAMALQDNLLFSVTNDSLFKIWDIADPSSPSQLGEVLVGQNRALQMEIDQDVVYITNSFGFLKAIDITDPTAPVVLGQLPQFVFETDLAVSGGLALIDQGSRLLFVDVQQPESMSVIDSMDFTVDRWARSYALDGNTAYLLHSGNDGYLLEIVDVSDPDSRFTLSLSTLSESSDPTELTDLAFDQGMIYAMRQNFGVHVIDVTDPSMPSVQSFIPLPFGRSLTAHDGYVTINAEQHGVFLIDASQPNKPILKQVHDTTFEASDAEFYNGALLVSGGDGLERIDASGEANPILGFSTTSNARDIAMSDSIAVVADGIGGVKFIDISDSHSPTVIHSDAGSGRTAEIFDQYAFVVEGHLGLNVWDLSDPKSISYLGGFDIPGDLYGDISIEYPLAYLACQGRDVIDVVDISDPTDIRLQASIPTAHSPIQIVVHNNLALYSCYDSSTGQSAIVALDVSDLANTTTLDTLELVTDEVAFGLELVESKLYIANEQEGLLVVDASNPSSLAITSTHSVNGSASDVCVFGTMLYVSVSQQGLFVFDISNQPSAPVQIGTYATVDATGVDVRDDLIAVSTNNGLQLIDPNAGCAASCTVDFNNDGTLNFFDVSAFLAAYLDNNPAADFNGDGLLNFFDVSAFLVDFSAGCP